MSNVLQIYLPDDFDREAMKVLARRLDAAGEDMRDQRGNISLSKLVRHLVNEALEKESEEE